MGVGSGPRLPLDVDQRRDVVGLEDLESLLTFVPDPEEEDLRQLTDAVDVAPSTRILPHFILKRFH
jgi:hypothetical protein